MIFILGRKSKGKLGIFKQTNAVSDIAGTLDRKVILLFFKF
jgi:hypothetical protein